MHPDRVRVIVLACVVLHNMLRREMLVVLGTWMMRRSPVTWILLEMVQDLIGTQARVPRNRETISGTGLTVLVLCHGRMQGRD